MANGRVIESRWDAGSAKARANAAAVKALWAEVQQQEETIRGGGGMKAVDAQHAKGRLTARERIARLVDGPESGKARSEKQILRFAKDDKRGFAKDDKGGLAKDDKGGFAKDDKRAFAEGCGEFLELGLWAAHGMYEEWGGAPSAGVVAGIGRVQGRLCMIVANDATVKAGAFFPMTAKKVLRAQTIALENRIPTLYLVDSSGVFLPLQEEVFPDQDDFGRVFRNNAVMSALGVPQMTAIMGMCVAGGAYLPVMTDTVLMTEGSGLFLAGPALVQAAIGQKTPAEELGGAVMHAEVSGTVDFKEPDDASCLERMRSLVGMMGRRALTVDRSPLTVEGVRGEVFSRVEFDPERDKPLYPAEELYGLLDPAPGASNIYDMREVIARIVDRSEWDEYKPDFGKTVLCGYARIGGRAVGIVANQKLNQRQTVALGPMAGTERIEVGGVIYTEGAQKAARFIMDCNQSLVPLLFLHDVNGFMVGKDAEWSGIIRAGAKMVSAVSTSVVPKISVIVGGSFGAGHYAMCGKAYDPRFLFAWPTARYAVMGGAAAANTLAEVKAKQLERSGEAVSEEKKRAIWEEIKAGYDAAADPRYGAARLWVDAIIDPAKTREVLMLALEACALNADVAKFNPGVIQT